MIKSPGMRSRENKMRRRDINIAFFHRTFAISHRVFAISHRGFAILHRVFVFSGSHPRGLEERAKQPTLSHQQGLLPTHTTLSSGRRHYSPAASWLQEGMIVHRSYLHFKADFGTVQWMEQPTLPCLYWLWKGVRQPTPWLSLEDTPTLRHPAETNSHNSMPIWKLRMPRHPQQWTDRTIQCWNRSETGIHPITNPVLLSRRLVDAKRHRRTEARNTVDPDNSSGGPRLRCWPCTDVPQISWHPAEDRKAQRDCPHHWAQG